mmetsp:Transcript_31245/g.41339  ORF Transcript_31245/g.41339 Transcript_31245/m.41339 type:complete len:87 (-) Transcript_31245:198-458(-)|eukprot:CAMPEP_0185570160 /NCGR_PEP_ID=MMETSP0434-20130131/2572_1 /TAXON_ID=626734 ORGANISM="Favella taraikaensis, Strain Fe Narragansett Bay" /NCGR_SAMPLE_ID=MMETSP0434 /ASSEMBLY_ACC=CAM_ASM_000379 /LENGTH=86 /DNA_ID=CAMNT_0028185199 /DNA_START=106 /DNA_END=366 /DNA_ORIENTATION=-
MGQFSPQGVMDLLDEIDLTVNGVQKIGCKFQGNMFKMIAPPVKALLQALLRASTWQSNMGHEVKCRGNQAAYQLKERGKLGAFHLG